MKTIKLLLLIVITTLSTASFAQQSYLENPNWGDNPDEREANAITFNFYRNAIRSKDYASAVGYLQELMVKSPKGSENIYIYGIRIYESKVIGATSLEDKKVALDSVMFLYDKRAELFGDSPKGEGLAAIKEYKAHAYHKHNPSDLEGVQKLFNEAIEAGGDDINLRLVNFYFKQLTDGYAMDIVEVDQLLDNYNKLIVIFDNSSDTTAVQAKEVFESLFLSSGAANCENLEMLFKDKIAQSPDSLELVEKVFNLLAGSNCEGEFYLTVAEDMYALKPTAKVAITLASSFQEKKEYEKALRYLNEAVANETDPTSKTNLYVSIAGTELALKNLPSAVKYADMAIGLSPNNPYAYIILGSAYIQGSEECDEFKKRTVYWLAHDIFMNARRNLAAEDPQMENVQHQLMAFAGSFPTTEECFFIGLNEGEAYSVNCGWIKKETTVRFRK